MTDATAAGTASAAAAALFRSCPTTGLKVHKDADALIKANAVAATVALLVGGIAAILVLLTRWQAVHLLGPELFYRWLTIHGMNMLIFFIIFFEMAVLYFASAVLLNSRVAAPKVGWLAFALMVGGALMVEWTMFTGRADVLFTSYVPLRAHPLFYLGVILFAVGAILVTGIFFATLVVAKREATYTGSVPLVTFGAITAAIIAAITLGHGAAIYIPTFLWSLGVMGVDPQVYRLVDPGFGPSWKVVNTSYFMYMAVLASMLHGFTVPAGVEMGMRLRGFTQGIFGWLRRAPWRDPGFSALVLSVVVFGFVGGITGVTFGTEQINIVAHNTLRIPGHFHATVVSGTAMAFMGITYYLIPLVFRKRVAFYPLARVQPYVFAGGMLLFSLTMTFAGTFGVPRRHYDITFAGALFSLEYSPAVNLLLALMALGGLTAIVGGAIYILVTVWSVFFGRPLGDETTEAALAGSVPPGVYGRPFLELPQEDTELEEHGALGMMPGTMVLVLIFIMAFIVYYFANWKLLSEMWRIG
jgi:cytochrome c oxidase subunit 1